MRKIVLLISLSLLAGCAQVRELTMTKDELRLYGSWEVRSCLDPDVICIVDRL
jgi:uncharacterized protein YceK